MHQGWIYALGGITKLKVENLSISDAPGLQPRVANSKVRPLHKSHKIVQSQNQTQPISISIYKHIPSTVARSELSKCFMSKVILLCQIEVN